MVHVGWNSPISVFLKPLQGFLLGGYGRNSQFRSLLFCKLETILSNSSFLLPIHIIFVSLVLPRVIPPRREVPRKLL